MESKPQGESRRFAAKCNFSDMKLLNIVIYCQTIIGKKKAGLRSPVSGSVMSRYAGHPHLDRASRMHFIPPVIITSDEEIAVLSEAFGPNEIAVLSGCFQHQWREVVAQLVPAICATLGDIFTNHEL